jgi:hypothetical protein
MLPLKRYDVYILFFDSCPTGHLMRRMGLAPHSVLIPFGRDEESEYEYGFDCVNDN